MHIPLIALDVDLVLDSTVPAYKIMQLWTKSAIEINFNVEFLCIKIRDKANIVLLSQYDVWQNKLIKDKIDHACYNYFVSVRNADEFEMFRDNMHPYIIVSNIPKIWKAEYSGVITYHSWTDAFDSLREDISLTEITKPV